MASGKYSVFKSNPDLKRWLTNLSRDSPITAEVYMRRVRKICELLDTTLKGLLVTSRTYIKGFQDSLEDLVTKLESEKKSPGYIRGLLKSVRSWLRYNDVTLTRKIKISNPNTIPTIEDE